MRGYSKCALKVVAKIDRRNLYSPLLHTQAPLLCAPVGMITRLVRYRKKWGSILTFLHMLSTIGSVNNKSHIAVAQCCWLLLSVSNSSARLRHQRRRRQRRESVNILALFSQMRRRCFSEPRLLLSTLFCLRRWYRAFGIFPHRITLTAVERGIG